MSDNTLCVWTKGMAYVNFRPSAFKAALARQGRGDEYRRFMRIFRTFGWIVCQHERFTNVQWINGKSVKVISVDYEKHGLMKALLGEGSQEEILVAFIKTVDKLVAFDRATDKRICVYSKDKKILKVKGGNFKRLIEKDCGNQYRKYMTVFRTLEWIICDHGKFSTIQKIDGKTKRVASVDFEKYKLMKELLTDN